MGQEAAAGGMFLLQTESASAQASAIRSQADFQIKQMHFNKKIADINAEDALNRGKEAEAQYKAEASRVKGKQVVSLAAQGIEIDSGSAAQIQYETDRQISTNLNTIKNNAWREAWGYKVEGVNLNTEARLTKMAADNEAKNTILAGGLQAINSAVGIYGAGGG